MHNININHLLDIIQNIYDLFLLYYKDTDYLIQDTIIFANLYPLNNDKNIIFYQIKSTLSVISNRVFVHNLRNKLTVLYLSSDQPKKYKQQIIEIVLWLDVIYTKVVKSDLHKISVNNYLRLHQRKQVSDKYINFLGYLIFEYNIDDIVFENKDGYILINNKNNLINIDKLPRNHEYTYNSSGLLICSI